MPTEVDEDLIEVAGWLFIGEANQALARRKYSIPWFQLLGTSSLAFMDINPSQQLDLTVQSAT